MPTPDQLRSWSRTTKFLAEAKALMAKAPLAQLEGGLREVDEFLDHNELGIASDWLRSIAEEAYWQNVEILKLLALAESSMGRFGNRDALDFRLTQLLGEMYETELPAV